jgi:hypothetical protein
MPTSWTILHGGALGDLVLAVQFARCIREIRDAGELVLISRTRLDGLEHCRPRIRWVDPESVQVSWFYAEDETPPPERLCNAICGKRVFNVLGGPDAVVHDRLTRLQPLRLLSLDVRPGDQDVHITEQWRRRLRAQGARDVDAPPAAAEVGLGVAEDLCERGRIALGRHGLAEPVVLIHPGSGGRAKCWPLENFVQVARRLRAARLGVAFVLGEVEAELWPDGQKTTLATEFPTIFNPPASDLAVILAASAVCLGNDAGPAHLAALLGTPTVTIFGPTSPTVWRPLGHGSIVIIGDPSADAARWAIDPDMVEQRVRAIVQISARRRHAERSDTSRSS